MAKEKDDLMDVLVKKFGIDSVINFNGPPKRCDFIPTGILSLDRALGIGGIPRGKITEIYGPEASGKSSVCLNLVANAQKMGLKTFYIDTEHALNADLAQLLGVDLSNFLFSQPDGGEEALQMIRVAADSGQVGLIILDSVGALATKQEINGEIGDSNVGGIARMMAQAMRLIVPPASNNNVAVVFVNQVRMKIGVMFGNPETTPGGLALRYASSVRIAMSTSTAIKEGDDTVGRIIKANIIKNKLAAPAKNCSFEVIYSQNLVALYDLLALATESGLITKSGSWFNYGSTRIGQGKNNAITWMIENPEIQSELITKVKSFYSIPSI